MASKLPASLYAPEQIEAVLFQLDDYLGVRRREDTKRRANVVSKGPAADLNWTSELEGVIGTAEQAAQLSLADLETKVKEITSWRDFPVVSLTLPVRPPAKLKTQLVEWFRREISAQVLIKFSVNSGIIGGIIVRTPQRIHDFSFRRRLEDNQSKIPQMFQQPSPKNLTSSSK